MKTFRQGGIHPKAHKLTASASIIELELPREVTLILSQHIGAPAKPIVAKGDKVQRGDMVAEAGGFVSAPVHTPISGTVVRLDRVKTPQGLMTDAIIIKSDDEEHLRDEASRKEPFETKEEPSAEEIIDIVGKAGIVGLGGATFPTRVKLTPPKGMKADVVIINGAECEPYLTNDHALMLSQPEAILRGTSLLMKAAGTNRAVIGIEANKGDAIALLTEKAKGFKGIEIMPLKVKYPQGGEKQLIQAVTGREVPSGALPIAAGALVQNIATAYAVDEAVNGSRPLTERIVTVTGPSVSQPGNFKVALGTPLSVVVEAAGGVPEDTGKIILGGPMMGRSAVTLDTPSTKGVSGILLLPEKESRRREVEPCIRCGACIQACPMGLEPLLISTLSRLGRYEEARDEKIMNCIECGSCSWACPANRPLLDYIRLGKGAVRNLPKE